MHAFLLCLFCYSKRLDAAQRISLAKENEKEAWIDNSIVLLNDQILRDGHLPVNVKLQRR